MTKRLIAVGRRLQSDRMPDVANSEPIRLETVKGLRRASERVFEGVEKSNKTAQK